MSREILQQTLDALRRVGEYGDIYRYKNTEQSPYTQIYEAIDALNVELAKPEQEPVAWMEMVVVNLVRLGVVKHKAKELAYHFYTYDPPPRKPWVSLSDAEEIELDEKYGDDFNAYIDARDAKLKEKNI
jgi:hypothetical protein